MGLLDEVLGAAVPGGNVAKPLMVALGTLLATRAAGSIFGRAGASAPTPPAAPPTPPAEPQERSAVGGLSGLLQRFQQSGHGDVIGSWIGSGPNQAIAPDQLHQALGADAVGNLSRLTGLPQNQLLAELSRVLPGIVDKLTPQGRIPDPAEMVHW
jgi:uncharacterized protein YidB (DUF937 family)